MKSNMCKSGITAEVKALFISAGRTEHYVVRAEVIEAGKMWGVPGLLDSVSIIDP